MINIQDHTGKLISIPSPPQRIVSLVPSQTELLYDLGLEDRVVGITKFCVHPQKWFETKKRVGGTKNINVEIIKSLHPDLVIANKEENIKKQIELVELFCPVFTTDVCDLISAVKMMHDIGVITQTHETAEKLSNTILEKFNTLSYNHSLRALYLIWREPYMAAGGDTFINDMLKYAGFINCVLDKNRYPVITVQEMIDLMPDILLLSSEPYPFKPKHIKEIHSFLPNTRILLVDGTYYSWYGSRLIKSAEYFKSLN